MFQKILCAIDGSDHGRKALELAIRLAATSEAALLLVHNLLDKKAPAELERFAKIEGLAPHVTPAIDQRRAVEGRLEYGFTQLPEGNRAYLEIARHLLDDAEREARAAGISEVETLMTDGDTADNILRAAGERGVDCILLGSRGLSDLKAMVVGSVSHKVLNGAGCTCIVVK